MPESVLGKARPRPHSTDLDTLFLPAPFRYPTEPGSRAFALHLLQATGQFANEIRSPVLDRIVAARQAVGLESAVSACADPGDRIGWALPRGLAWTDYPVAGTPHVRIVRGRDYPCLCPQEEGGGYIPPVTPEGLFHDLGHLVIHLPADVSSLDPDRRRIALEWTATAYAYVEAAGDSVPVIVLTDDRHVLGYRPEIDAIVSAIAPWRRFHYSYAANFTAIGLKALEHAMETSDADAEALLDRLFDRGPSEEGVDRALLGVRERRLVEGALDPLWLQSLYALRRRKSIHVPFLGSPPGGWDEGRRALLTPEGRSHPCWVGTGRYPVRSLHPNETFAVSSCMVRYRLVAARGDDLILSETGNRFLDALHPDCEDVDMPVRWAGRELVGADVKSMDAWITRTFRRMKTRVNEL